MLDEILQGKRLEKYVPLINWITTYQRAWLRWGSGCRDSGGRGNAGHRTRLCRQVPLRSQRRSRIVGDGRGQHWIGRGLICGLGLGIVGALMLIVLALSKLFITALCLATGW